MEFDDIKQFSECKAPVGLKLKIISLTGENNPRKYQGQTGIITYIDDFGQIHGTWNSLAVIPELDKFLVIDDKNHIVYESEHFND